MMEFIEMTHNVNTPMQYSVINIFNGISGHFIDETM